MQEAQAKRRQSQNDLRVLDALRCASGPQTAYQILGQLKKHGVTGPTTVYRALHRLVADGTVHRIEALNAYVICTHPVHGTATMFIICELCNIVTEICDDRISAQLRQSTRNTGIAFKAASIEIRGTCANCLSEQPEVRI